MRATSRAWRFALAALCALMLAGGPSARAAEAPAHVERELGAARLAGQGVFTYFGLSIYTAELWVGPKGYRPAAKEAAPYVLDLRYARALDGRRIAEASAAQMEKIGAGSAAQRAAWLAKMQAIFPDVKEGSRLSGLFLPGEGVRFYRDGKPLATVADPAFAQAFFGIWLDSATTAPNLREALLRDAAPKS
ncbi:chalcone isomerase family protein [Oxalobacteraceae bacterium OTU3CAMAD1]|nr:chalcone isomerase family protein [Oxalobacteraceae bacterium OTU3CAMAD1]